MFHGFCSYNLYVALIFVYVQAKDKLKTKKSTSQVIGASLSEPHTSEYNGGIFMYIYTSVDAGHPGASLSKQ